MSIEYIFFTERFRDRFTRFVSSQGITFELRQDEMSGHVVMLPDDLDDEIEETIEDEYETLADEEQDELAESEDGWVTNDAMGVDIKLTHGQPCVVRIPAPFIRRLTENFTPDEIHALVTAIAHGVENPADGPICKML